MQTAAFRQIAGRQCRHTAVATAPLQRHRTARPLLVKVRATNYAPSDIDESSPGYLALSELSELEQSGKMDAASLDSFRLKYNMRRGVDGRMQLRRKDGAWFQLKLDNEVKGTLLLRNIEDGTVHVLQTDKLDQIDLSDDYLMILMFADQTWSETILPIQLGDESGAVENLTVTEQQFKDTIGFIKTLQEMEEDQGSYPDGGDDVEIEVDPSQVRRIRPTN